jgi:hypothetical protein
MRNWINISNHGIHLSNLFKIDAFKHNCSDVKPINEVFDFGFFFNSTEQRTLEFSKLFKKDSIKNSLLVDFKNETSQLKTQNIEKNRERLKLITSNYFEELIIPDIFNYDENLNILINKIPLSTFKVGAKCFIDITGVPLIYSVALLRHIKLAFPCPELYLLNVSAKYEVNEKKETPQFSDGFKENIYIPGYYGKPDFSRPWLYVFLLGFEGSRSLSIYKVNEPDFVVAIIAEPGYQNEYSTKAIEINKSFLTEAKIEHKDIIKIDAGDPVGVCNKVLDIYNEFKDRANICLVPLGTKPHAIGAGIAALIQNDIALMYQVPKSYSMFGSKAGDDMWVYVIK